MSSRLNIVLHLVCATIALALGIIVIHFGRHPIPLFGVDVLSSIGCLLAASGPIGFFLARLRHHRVDTISLVLFAASAVVSLHYIHISNDTAYTNDVTQHVERTSYVLKHWLEPYSYRGWQEHQPPVYYYLSAVPLAIAETLQGIPPLLSLRFFSWIAFLMFNFYSLLTLRHAGVSGMCYYAGAVLLLFWPASAHLASKISPEILYYAFYAASFYYLIRWYQDEGQGQLMKSVILAGVALSIKTNAITLFAVLGLVALLKLMRMKWSIRSIKFKGWLFTALVLALCIFINMGLVILAHTNVVSSHLAIFGYRPQPLTISHFILLDYEYAIMHPFADWTANQTLWDYLFKSSMFGEYEWPSRELAAIMNIMLWCIVVYAIAPRFFMGKNEWKGMAPFLIGLLIPFMGLLTFTILTRDFTSQDARYIYPSLVCFVAFFARNCAFCRERNTFLASLGPALAATFAGLSVFFFWTNFR